jgi:MFS family permease
VRALIQPLAARVYYGWVILGAVSFTEVVSWGILYYGFSVFVAPMQAELGWSQATITSAFSLALLCSGLAAVPVGRWLDRHGPRALMTAGSIAGSSLLVAWSAVQSVWAFYLVLAGIGAAMAAVLYEPAFVIVATWFRQKRGRALTVLTFFGAWASLIFIPLASWLVEHFGWRQALLALAALLAAGTILPHALLLRRRPADLGLLPDGAPAILTEKRPDPPPEPSLTARAALGEAGFWWLSCAFAASTFATVSLTVHLIPYLVSRGHPPAFAATVAGLFGLMSLAGRLLIGPLGDRFARPLVTAALLAMQAIGLVVLAVMPTAAGALVFIALFGAGSGTMTIMRAALLAERYGAANYGVISGAQNAVLTGARTFAPLGAGLLAAALGGYPLLLLGLGGLCLAGLVAMLCVRRAE